MTEYTAAGDGIKFYFSFDDDDNPTLVTAWIDEIPGSDIDGRTRHVEAAVERACGKQLSLRCLWAKGSEYKFKVL